MYDTVVSLGQAYGLWITVAFLILIIIFDKIESKRYRKEIEKLRAENHDLKKIGGDVLNGRFKCS
ncbi:hypothetical protein Osc1_18510 [Hominimerdicola sp. 21CYCFAH17_S]